MLTNIMTRMEVNFIGFGSEWLDTRSDYQIECKLIIIEIAEAEEDPNTPKHRTSVPQAPGMTYEL